MTFSNLYKGNKMILIIYNKIKIFINNNNSTHRQAHCLVAHKAHTPAKPAKELASPHSDFPTRKN